ncbi:MAG: small subunit ribosomal protein S4e [Candidatus Woesearchaeota archaeon]|jgi:small subunit ribosomal protein S4e
MGKDHLKSIAAPRTWPVSRKESVFVARPKSGKPMELSLPLVVVLRNLLKVCETTKQVKAALTAGHIKVANKLRKDCRYPVGLFDVVELVPDAKSYRLVLSEFGRLNVIPVAQKETARSLQQIRDIMLVKGGQTQISLRNGGNVIVDKKDASKYHVGDSVILDETNSIVKHIELKPGVYVQFSGGRHIGQFGTVETIEHQKIIVKSEKKHIETLKQYAYAVGDKTSELTITQ